MLPSVVFLWTVKVFSWHLWVFILVLLFDFEIDWEGISRRRVTWSGIGSASNIIGFKTTKMCLKSKDLSVHWNGFTIIQSFMLTLSLWCCLAFIFSWYQNDVPLLELLLLYFFFLNLFFNYILRNIVFLIVLYLSLGLVLSKTQADGGRTWDLYNTCFFFFFKTRISWVFYG